ncbi:MAG: methyltransferase domain-containing protein [Candidatus Heimdallarchaeota archaeon]|nr:methyltransferase domain-containing protein [Candidatus Heimdallarchaeota archaeon]
MMLKVLGLFLFQWESQARRRFIKSLGIEKGSNILDICTGTGNNLPALKKYTTDDSELVAIDLSEKMIQKCQEKVQKKKIPASIHRGNALQLP